MRIVSLLPGLTQGCLLGMLLRLWGYSLYSKFCRDYIQSSASFCIHSFSTVSTYYQAGNHCYHRVCMIIDQLDFGHGGTLRTCVCTQDTYIYTHVYTHMDVHRYMCMYTNTPGTCVMKT